MEKAKEAITKSKKYISTADHMLTITYPLVKDPKLLLPIMENIFLSFSKAMAAILYFERYYKRIPPFHDTYESKFNMFRLKIVNKYNINKEYVSLIEEIKSIIVQHKNSPVEFVRRDVFVICSDDYSMKTLNVNEMKEIIAKAKIFIADINNLLNKNTLIK